MIKKISTSVNNTFIPEWDGNRELPAGEQIRVRHKSPSVAMKERLFPREFSVAQRDADSKDMLTSMSIVVDRKKVIAEMVDGIDNCGYEGDDGTVKHIKTAAQLFESPIEFDPLIEEIYNYLQGLLVQKVDEKN